MGTRPKPTESLPSSDDTSTDLSQVADNEENPAVQTKESTILQKSEIATLPSPKPTYSQEHIETRQHEVKTEIKSEESKYLESYNIVQESPSSQSYLLSPFQLHPSDIYHSLLPPTELELLPPTQSVQTEQYSTFFPSQDNTLLLLPSSSRQVETMPPIESMQYENYSFETPQSVSEDSHSFFEKMLPSSDIHDMLLSQLPSEEHALLDAETTRKILEKETTSKEFDSSDSDDTFKIELGESDDNNKQYETRQTFHQISTQPQIHHQLKSSKLASTVSETSQLHLMPADVEFRQEKLLYKPSFISLDASKQEQKTSYEYYSNIPVLPQKGTEIITSVPRKKIEPMTVEQTLVRHSSIIEPMPGPSGLQQISSKQTSRFRGRKNQCVLCGKSFNNVTRLDSHLRSCHSQDELMAIALQRQQQTEQLHQQQNQPPRLSQFICEDCNKCFNSKFKLVRHQLIHSDRPQFSCTVCNRMFHRKDHLKNHIKIHNPTKHVHICDREHCQKEYTSILSYRKHLAIHFAEEGALDCKICSKQFESKQDLLAHLKIHAGSRPIKNPSEKKYLCDMCDRKFFTKKDVRRHSVVHTGRRDFLCQYCPQRFGRKDHLVRHVKKTHSTTTVEVKKEVKTPKKINVTSASSSFHTSSSTSGENISGTIESETSQITQFYSTHLFPQSKPSEVIYHEFEMGGTSTYPAATSTPIAESRIQSEYLPLTQLQSDYCSMEEAVNILQYKSIDLSEQQQASSALDPVNVLNDPRDIFAELITETELMQSETSGNLTEVIKVDEPDSGETDTKPLPGFSQAFQQNPP